MNRGMKRIEIASATYPVGLHRREPDEGWSRR